jgi:hypothetical protein
MEIAKELLFVSGYAAVEQHVLVVQELSSKNDERKTRGSVSLYTTVFLCG